MVRKKKRPRPPTQNFNQKACGILFEPGNLWLIYLIDESSLTLIDTFHIYQFPAAWEAML